MARLLVASIIPAGAKMRTHMWIDTKSLKSMYGVQVRVDGRFCHLIRDRAPVLFDTEQEARSFISIEARRALEQGDER